MRWMKLKRSIYPCTIYFAQGGGIREISAKLKRLKLEPNGDYGHQEVELTGNELGFTLKLKDRDGKFAILVWVRSAKRNPKDVSVICHECLHVTYYVFKHIGQEHGAVCYDDQETHTYFLDYLVKEACTFFWKQQLYDVSI